MAIVLAAMLAEIFSTQNIVGYYDTMRQEVRPFLGEALFPSKRVNGMTLKSISGHAGPPVNLRPSSFDAVAPIRPRIPFKSLQNEMMFYREGMTIGEKERQELFHALRAGGIEDPFTRAIIEGIYNDELNLLLGADSATEWMRMMLLSTGFIKGDVDGIPMDYDYGFDVSMQMTTLVGDQVWTNHAKSNPIKVINDAKKAARMSNARIVMSEDTYTNMLMSESIKGYMFATSTMPSYVLPSTLEQYVREATKVEFVALSPEENTFRERVNGPDIERYPDGVFTLLPQAGAIGSTNYGTTPEEIDLVSGAGLDITVTKEGIAVVSKVKAETPVTQETWASQIVLPTIDRPDRMHIVNAY